MDLIAVLFWFMYLVQNPIAADEAYETTTGTTTETTINTIDVLQNQLNQILVQFCASEIDRNKTTSAILKFGQLADPKASIENVVKFYIENYEENFDNLLHFIDHISSFELQQIAYNKLIDIIKLNQINVVNLLSFENFIRNKLELNVLDESIEQKFYENLLLILGSHIKELILSTNLNRVATLVNNSKNPDRIFELIPTIVKGIDLNNFTDVDRIFEFCIQLPKENQIKLISKVLSEMAEKTQYKHVYHVIGQIRKIRNFIDEGVGGWTLEDLCLLSGVENSVPPELKPLISEFSRWRIKYFDSDHEFLSYSDSHSQNLLFVNEVFKAWYLKSSKYNSVYIGSESRHYHYHFLTIDYCFHNDSFPVAKQYDAKDLFQQNWYLLMSDDLSYFQIKNIFTNQFLLVEDMRNAEKGRRVALSAQCSDLNASKWSLSLESSGYSNSAAVMGTFRTEDNMEEIFYLLENENCLKN